MSCEWRDKVILYADDEQDAQAREGFSAHLASCAECAAALNAQAEFKKMLRIAGKSFAAPPAVHAAVYRSIHPGRSVSPWWKWALGPLCLILLGTIAFLSFSRTDRDSMISGLVDQHITNLASASPVEVASEDTHTVKPWFQGKLPFTFNLPDLPRDGTLQLIGGKVAYAGQQPGAHLWYQAGRHKISVFVLRARPGEGTTGFNRDLSFGVNSWVQGGLQYYLVTDANQSEAGKLVSLFQEANRQ